MNDMIWYVLSLISVFVTGFGFGQLIAGVRPALRQKFLNEHLGSRQETELDKEFRAWCEHNHPVRYHLFVR